MSEKAHQLHHCERCSAVFSAPPKIGSKVICSECGESPIGQFISRAKVEEVVDTDQVHGVAGKDVADFVSMQKIRRKKQARLALVFWGVLLVAVPATIFYFNGQKTEELEEEKKAAQAEANMRKTQAQQALRAALGVYVSYKNADDANARSAFVVGGVKQLLKLNEEGDNITAVRASNDSRLVNMAYFPEGEYPRVETILEDPSGAQFEAVLWKGEDGWKYDWEQAVRYSDGKLKDFLAYAKAGDSAEFRLLARRRYTASMQPDQDLQLLLYQPAAALGVRLAESPQVDLSSENPLHQRLTEQFEKLEKQQPVYEGIIARNDGPGMLRVRVQLTYVKGPEGERKLQLDSVKAFHWMAFEPAETQ